MQEVSSTSLNRSSAIRIAIILLVGAVLRVIFLDARSLWADEIVSVKLATDNWGGFKYWIFSREANMACYYLLLRAWVKLGDGETWVRLLSALAGIATIPLFYSLVRRLYDERVGWVAALLAATSACLVEFSQEARSYSLLLLLCVLSYYFFIRLLQQGRTWIFAGYVLVSICALYAHFFAALVIAAQAASVLWLPPKAVKWGRMTAAWVAIGLGAIPISVYVLKRDVGQLYWVQPTTIPEVYKLAVFFAGASKGVAVVLSIVSLFAVMAAIASNARVLQARTEATWKFMVSLLWAALPVVLTVLVSLHRPIFVHRYLLVALPGYLILIALALARIPSRAVLTAALAIFIGLSSVSIVQGYFRPVEDWRGVVNHVLSHTRPDDAVMIYIPYGVNNFIFYTARRERMGLKTYSGKINGVDSVKQLESIESPRTWLLIYPSPHAAENAPLFVSTLKKRYANYQDKQFKGVEVILFNDLRSRGLASQ